MVLVAIRDGEEIIYLSLVRDILCNTEEQLIKKQSHH